MTARFIVSWLTGALAALGIATAAQADEIVVGGKNFTEQLLLAEMTAQLLKAKGFEVEKRDGMGSKVALFTHSASTAKRSVSDSFATYSAG